jgi:hypothetical protein
LCPTQSEVLCATLLEWRTGSDGRTALPVTASTNSMSSTQSSTTITHAPRFDDPRFPGGMRPDLYIGPPRQLGGPLLEVMLEVHTNGSLLIFHAMEARPKMLALLEGEERQ